MHRFGSLILVFFFLGLKSDVGLWRLLHLENHDMYKLKRKKKALSVSDSYN